MSEMQKITLVYTSIAAFGIASFKWPILLVIAFSIILGAIPWCAYLSV